MKITTAQDLYRISVESSIGTHIQDPSRQNEILEKVIKLCDEEAKVGGFAVRIDLWKYLEINVNNGWGGYNAHTLSSRLEVLGFDVEFLEDDRIVYVDWNNSFCSKKTIRDIVAGMKFV